MEYRFERAVESSEPDATIASWIPNSGTAGKFIEKITPGRAPPIFILDPISPSYPADERVGYSMEKFTRVPFKPILNGSEVPGSTIR